MGEKNKEIEALIDIVMSNSSLISLLSQCQDRSLHYLKYVKGYCESFS